MIITNEELENYLELWKKTEGDKITVSRDLFLTLATEVLICREQAIEEREVSLLRCQANHKDNWQVLFILLKTKDVETDEKIVAKEKYFSSCSINECNVRQRSGLCSRS